jgi:hypothetical protein
MEEGGQYLIPRTLEIRVETAMLAASVQMFSSKLC